MADAADFRRIALALPGATEVPHVDRRAFKARITFATLAPDELTANLRFTAEDQEFRCTTILHGFALVPGGWGRMGWTQLTLAALDQDQLTSALAAAWQLATTKPSKRRRLP